mgnify:CR=1 FL=1
MHLSRGAGSFVAQTLPASPLVRQLGTSGTAAAAKRSGSRARTLQRRAYQTGSQLQKIPGVGPKTATLFHEQGIGSVEQLNAKLVQEDVSLADPDQIADFLREQVGVRHRRHANLIAEYVIEKMGDGPPVTVSIEGNISVGKSTLIKHMQSADSKLRNTTEFVLEPVERWQDVRGHNILEAFYDNPERYAYTFQSFVFLTRLLDGGLTPSQLPHRLLERSVFSDSMVFLRAIHNAQWLTEMEFDLLTTYFSPLCRKFPQIIPNGFIYLRANPETCYQRLQGRNRTEESTVSLPYLEQIHQYHEQWFEPCQTLALPHDDAIARPRGVSMSTAPAHPDGHFDLDGRNFGKDAFFANGPIFDTDRLPLIGSRTSPVPSSEIPELIRDNVVYLRGRDGFAVFEHIPTLVLDCDDGTESHGVISSLRDDADQERFARHALMVESFFSFLREQQRKSGAIGDGHNSHLQGSGDAVDREPSAIEFPTHINGHTSTPSGPCESIPGVAWSPDTAADRRGQEDAARLLTQLVRNMQ